MSSYIRKLSYLYYYENRQKGVNAGYVRLERRDAVIRFQMNIRFRIMDDTPLILYLYGKPKGGRWVLIPLGNCQIKNRQLFMRFIKKETEMLPDGISVEDIYGIFLPLKGNRCFAGSWNDRDGSEYFRFMDWIGTNGLPEELAASSIKEDEDSGEQDFDGCVDTAEAEDKVEEILQNCYTEDEYRQEEYQDREDMPKEDRVDDAKQEKDSKESDLKSLEWTPPEQAKDWLPIWEEKITPELVFSVYPSLPEFLFCKKCIRIEPQDIGILPMESWYLASNSFLLHGYYNFNHLLLGWKTDKPEAFILGVPGIYDRREKVMAGMFGFEAFEIMGRRDPDKSPIPEGAMGYWYRRIEPSLRQENK